MSIKLTVEGRQSDVVAVWKELNGVSGKDFKVEEINRTMMKDVPRGPAGMEPMTYFVVVVAGHLTAALAHDLLAKCIGPAVKEKWKRISVKAEKDAKK